VAPPQAPAAPVYVNLYAKPGAVPAKVAPAGKGAPFPTPAQGPDVADLAAQVEALRGVVRAQADDALAGVPANIAATVRSLAGEDPAAQLSALRTMRANGLVVAPAAIPTGATTLPGAPPAPPPPATPATAEAAVLAEHTRLSGVSPILAANFYRSNADTIERARRVRN
jgi:hypothetical protein